MSENIRSDNEIRLGILKGLPLFSCFSIEEIREMVQNRFCSFRSFSQGQVIHLEGDKCTEVEILLTGTVTIERIGQQGNLMVIARFKSGDMLGGNLVFAADDSYPMTVTARTDCQLYSMKKDMVVDLMLSNRKFLLSFLSVISDNTSVLSHKIRQTVHQSIRECILDYAVKQIAIQDSNPFKLTMSKKDLADSFGVQRTSLSRELKKMKNEGLIDYGPQTITLIAKQHF